MSPASLRRHAEVANPSPQDPDRRRVPARCRRRVQASTASVEATLLRGVVATLAALSIGASGCGSDSGAGLLDSVAGDEVQVIGDSGADDTTAQQDASVPAETDAASDTSADSAIGPTPDAAPTDTSEDTVADVVADSTDSDTPSVQTDAGDASADASDASPGDTTPETTDDVAQDTLLVAEVIDLDVKKDTGVVGPPNLTLLIPKGAAMFFLQGSCPAGWDLVDGAEGRLIKGTAPGNTVGLAVGAPLGANEDRTHTHSVSASIPVNAINGVAAASGCCNSEPAAAQTVTINADTIPASSGLPIIHQRLCARIDDDDPSDGHPFPEGTILFFDRPDCPAGWTPHGDAQGRFVVSAPAGGTPGQTTGQPLDSEAEPAHTHAMSGSFTVPERSLAAVGGGNKSPGAKGSYAFSGTTGSAKIGLPYLQLLACRAMPQSLPAEFTNLGEEVPSASVAFFETAGCPADWNAASDLDGRFVAALPAGSEPGRVVGGPPLSPGEDRAHGHSGGGTVELADTSLAIASGCCFKQAGAAGIYAYSLSAAAVAAGLPYLTLRACAAE